MKKMRFLLEVLVPALLTGMLASMAEGRTHYYDFVVSTILAPITHACRI